MKLRTPSVALLLVLAAACKDEKITVDAGSIDAGSTGLTVGGKLGQAIASAEQQPKGDAPRSGSNGDGPPENGVFSAAAADKAIAKNAPPKVEVVSDGADPKSVLTFKPSDEAKVILTVQTVRQGRGIPPMALSLALKIDKKDKSAPEGAAIVVAKVNDAAAPSDANLPKDAVAALSKLKGAEIKYQLGGDGSISSPQFALPKDADPALTDVLGSAVDALVTLTPVLPKKPVGVGAYWMVSDRALSMGLDVLRYRLFKIEKMEKDVISFSIDLRAYSAGDSLDAGRGQKLTISAFDGKGKGDVTWSPSSLIVAPAQLEEQIGAQLSGAQKGMLQAQMAAKIEPSNKSDKAAKPGK